MKKIDLDEVINLLGGWGKFQILYYVPLFCVVIYAVFPPMSYIFVARDIKYRCKIDSCNEDYGEYNPVWLKDAVPFQHNKPSRCQYYQPLENDTCTRFSRNTSLSCDEFVYERNQTTIVQDFNITCDENLWKLTLVGTVNVLGKMTGLPFIGLLSDRFGRKLMVTISVTLSTIMGLIRSFSTSYYMYMVFVYLDTFFGAGIYSGAFILAMEIVDSQRHNLGGVIMAMAFTVGHVVLGIAAWLTPSWRYMLRVLYIFGFVVSILMWFLPESIRWLLSKEKTTKAENVLKKMAKTNSIELDDFSLNNLPNSEVTTEENKEEKMKTSVLVVRIIHCCYTWMCCNLTYYGIAIESVELFQDIYVNFICMSLTEIPAYFICFCVIDRLGRRITLASSLILTGVFCIGIHFVEPDTIYSMAIFLAGKLFVTIAYTVVYIFTAELFPTSSRHSSFACCSMFGCFGSMIAPQIPLMARLLKNLPLMIFSAAMISSGLLSFLFPETYKRKKSIEDKNSIPS